MSTSNRPLEGLRVLIAEDSWHLADALRQALSRAGAEVDELAGTLEEVEQMSAAPGVDAVVMDLNLHGRMAHALAERLAAAGMKVVVLTGYERTPTLAAKVHACLTKPVATDVLIAELMRPLAR